MQSRIFGDSIFKSEISYRVRVRFVRGGWEAHEKFCEMISALCDEAKMDIL